MVFRQRIYTKPNQRLRTCGLESAGGNTRRTPVTVLAHLNFSLSVGAPRARSSSGVTPASPSSLGAAFESVLHITWFVRILASILSCV